MPAAGGVHLPRSLPWRLSNNRSATSNKHRSTPRGSQSHFSISSPLPLNTPLPTVPSSMQNRQPLSKKSHKHIKRSQISGPLQLLSTTNSLAYTSPDLKTMGMGIDVGLSVSSTTRTDIQSAGFVPPPTSCFSRTASIPEEASLMSDTFSNGPGSVDSPLTSPSVAYSIEQDQSSASDHASPKSYFDHDQHSLARSARSHHGSDQCLAHQRRSARSACEVNHPQSVSSINSSQSCIASRSRSHCQQPPISAIGRLRIVSPPTNHLPKGMLNGSAPSAQLLASSGANDDHPFSKELAQVQEVAEEFGKGLTPSHARDPAREEDSADVRFLQSKGLKVFRASEYLTELEDFHASLFQTSSSPYSTGENLEADVFF
ncbi:hypothetical protein KEM54_000740 [Ascosphaera aggregata]|nr:hypothetical protein KEM54_000740 [Ascosphaera aggregata]